MCHAAVVYGNGVYFVLTLLAVLTPHQTRTGHKYMYFVRVLTGEYTRGSQGLLVPPSKDPTNPTILYDSVVDNVQNPSVFVTFSDASSYPEYLIVFK